ncbi:MAG: ABC-F family ATP-binding cassette domain-containing protein [Planctomycetia bacterium]|nr:ABC-F family ATP-binding cassette domain-containing protein [Planctomycetia bacterium]
MAVLLNVEHLRKHFGPEPVLSDITFQVREGDKIGLVGPNGCGKTTLLNILTGREESEKGSIEKPSEITIGYLEQRPVIDTSHTVRQEAQTALDFLLKMQREVEEIAVRMSDVSDPGEHERLARRYDRLHEELMRRDAYNLDYRVEMILHGVGFLDDDFDKNIAMLSGGELNRLSLAKLLLEEPDIMLLDEPSNHLDLLATEWLEDFLTKTQAAVILVSHDRYFLDKVTNRTLELFMGTVDDYPGNFSKYSQLKEERLLVQTRTYEKYVEEVEKAKDFIRRHHYGMKAAQAEDRRKKLERLEEQPAELPRKIVTPGMNFPPASRTGDIVFRTNHLAKGFLHPLFKDVSITIERGQRWAIMGPNGCGKSTFLKCLIGELSPDSGTVYTGEGVHIGYFDQQLMVLDSETPVVDAIRPEGKIFEELPRRKLLGAFGLTGDSQLQTVGSLSGGQRARAALARLAADTPNVMILDEPTNHLDLWARIALEEALRAYDGTVIFISHDRFFVDCVADHLLIIQPNARFRVQEGNYTLFRQLVAKGLITDPFLPNALEETNEKSVQKVQNQGNSSQKQNSTRSTTSRTDARKHEKNNRNPRPGKVQQTVPPPRKQIPIPTVVRKTNEDGPPRIDSGTPPQLSQPKGLGALAQADRDANWSEAAFKEGQGRGNTKPDRSNKKSKRQRKFPYRKTQDIEEEIFMRETHVMTLEEDLMRPEILRDGERVRELNAELTEERDALKLLYEHWDEASELNW